MVRELTERYKANIIDGTPEANLVAYYPALHGLGARLLDRSIYANHGTLYNGPTWVRLPSGLYVLSFDGVDDYVNINSVFGLGATNVTIENWIYLPDTSRKGAFVKIGEMITGYAIGVGSGDLDTRGNELITLFEQVRWIPTGKNIGTGWHRTGMMIDNAGVPSAYLDGVFVGSYPGTGARAPTLNSGIGGYPADSPFRFCGGLIALTRLYARALSPSEPLLHFNRERHLFGV